MSVKGTPAQIAAVIRTRALQLKLGLRAAERQTILAVQTEAKRLSSGNYSSATLAKMGHPYSKKRPRPPQDPGIINLQSGNFQRGWRRQTGSWSGGALSSFVFNVSREGVLLEAGGSSRSTQIRRDLVSLVLPTIRRARRQRLSDAIRKAL
ncbi:MAG: hypothetical protein JWN14_2466 [Chthonomonadales bacterium]|nr:hypothetical protein [Chthonomonadales bacterium]